MFMDLHTFQMVPRNYRIHCHCFTGNYASCQRWLNTFPNLFVGLTPVITYNSARPAQEVAACIPLDRLLLETDAPYFVPLEVISLYLFVIIFVVTSTKGSNACISAYLDSVQNIKLCSVSGSNFILS